MSPAKASLASSMAHEISLFLKFLQKCQRKTGYVSQHDHDGTGHHPDRAMLIFILILSVIYDEDSSLLF